MEINNGNIFIISSKDNDYDENEYTIKNGCYNLIEITSLKKANLKNITVTDARIEKLKIHNLKDLCSKYGYFEFGSIKFKDCEIREIICENIDINISLKFENCTIFKLDMLNTKIKNIEFRKIQYFLNSSIEVFLKNIKSNKIHFGQLVSEVNNDTARNMIKFNIEDISCDNLLLSFTNFEEIIVKKCIIENTFFITKNYTRCSDEVELKDFCRINNNTYDIKLLNICSQDNKVNKLRISPSDSLNLKIKTLNIKRAKDIKAINISNSIADNIEISGLTPLIHPEIHISNVDVNNKLLFENIDLSQSTLINSDILSRIEFLKSPAEKINISNCSFKIEEKDDEDCSNSKILSISILLFFILPLLFTNLNNLEQLSTPNNILFLFIGIISTLGIPIICGKFLKHFDFDIGINSDNTRKNDIFRQLSLAFSSSDNEKKFQDCKYAAKVCHLRIEKSKKKKIFDSIHYLLNGFGFHWFRAFIWYIFFILYFAFAPFNNPNLDYVATHSTPSSFLIGENKLDISLKVDDYKDINDKAHFLLDKQVLNYNSSDTKEKDNLYSQREFYGDDQKDNYLFGKKYIATIKDNMTTRIAYSISQMISPFTPEQKKWFKQKTDKAYVFSFIETFILWITFGAMSIALKNRLKR